MKMTRSEVIESLEKPPYKNQVQAARQSAGHTQAEAAMLVGRTVRAWQSWEMGERRMPAGSFLLYQLVCEALGRQSALSVDSGAGADAGDGQAGADLEF